MDIWTFAERFYGNAMVASLCLRMQRDHQAVVALVIWFCWVAANKRYITQSMFEQGTELISATQKNLILPVRELRKSAYLSREPQAQQITAALLQAEILLEKNQLERLGEFSKMRWDAKPSRNTYGLSDYLMSLGVQDVEQAAHFLYTQAETHSV